MSKQVRSILFVVFVFIALIFVVDRLVLQPPLAKPLDYSEFYRQVESDNVSRVTIAGHEVAGELRRGIGGNPDVKFTTTTIDDRDLVPELRKHNVGIVVESGTPQPFLGLIVQFVPFLLMALLLLFILRQAQSGGSQALSFGRSRAKLQ